VPEGLPDAPTVLVDRLTDHFLRVVPPTSLVWVHPSWRDLVIDDIAADAGARRDFVAGCSLEGLLLALSAGGGRTGTRSLPLLVADADWDAAAERLHELVPSLDERDALRLLLSLEASFDGADARATSELTALTAMTLERMGTAWAGGDAKPDDRVLEQWLDLSDRTAHEPPVPVLVALWHRAVPDPVAPYTIVAAERYRRWLRLTSSLASRSPAVLVDVGFPHRYGAQLDALLRIIPTTAVIETSGSLRASLRESFRILARLLPTHERRARRLADTVRSRPDDYLVAPGPEAWRSLRPRESAAMVRRILADLR
jgi:hypothetical protein